MVDHQPEREIQVRDEVKHKTLAFSGTVLAKYPLGGLIFIDVRCQDDSIAYRTLMQNWETVVPVEKLE